MPKTYRCSECKEKKIGVPAYRNGKILCQSCWSKYVKYSRTSLRKTWLDFLCKKVEKKKCKQK